MLEIDEIKTDPDLAMLMVTHDGCPLVSAKHLLC